MYSSARCIPTYMYMYEYISCVYNVLPTLLAATFAPYRYTITTTIAQTQ